MDALIPQKSSSQIPRSIWMLGLVSLFMDVASELIHSLLPLFMVSSLGVSALALGLIEGAAEATALIVKVFSGALSDYFGKRKGLTLFGYGLGAATKPLFALAQGSGLIFSARLLDRMAKGIRGAPRDALIADLAPTHLRGAAFGLRQSLDTVGAFMGPLLAVGLMLLWNNDFRRVFWVAVIPGIIAVLILFFGVKEAPAKEEFEKHKNPITRKNLKRLGSSYWWVVGICASLTLARFSEAFLVLRAEQASIPLAWIPLVLVVMNIVYATSAYPFGRISDRFSATKLLGWGILVLALADVVLASRAHWAFVLLGVSLWGLHLGMTQGILAALIARTAPPDLRGTAYGFFNLVSGVALLLGSGLAGWLWQSRGGASTFMGGLSFCLLSLLALGLGSRYTARDMAG